MSRMLPARSPAITLALATTLALAMAGCGAPSAPEPQAAAPVATESPADATTATPATAPAEDEAATALDAREQEIAARQVELELREREIAAREAAAAAAPKTAATPKTTATPKPAVTTTPAASAPVAAPPPPPVLVPEGTQLFVRLNHAYSTRTTPVGEPVQASLASDLVVDGRLIANAGATLSGSVTEVVSGSQKIGAVPALKIGFTQLALADGTTATINARVAQKGQSEKGRDTAKIVGGAAAGAIIGHQINDDKGSLIGGVVGATGGAVAAKKTGTELDLAAGAVVPATLRQSFEYRGK